MRVSVNLCSHPLYCLCGAIYQTNNGYQWRIQSWYQGGFQKSKGLVKVGASKGVIWVEQI